MKNLSFILVLMFTLSFIFTSCKKDEVEPAQTNILPVKFNVEIPAVLLADATKTTKSTANDVIEGNAIYHHLSTFIHAGDGAAKIVSEIISNIRKLNLSQPMSFTYEGEDDTRAKNVEITADSEFDGIIWQYQMNITDADSEGNDDGGIGIQIFWNNSPVKGVAIIKPINMNKNEINLFSNAMFRIDYSEAGENSYEQEMTVYISGLTLENPLHDPYSMETMKMTVGKNGNIIEVFGNSNHPNAILFSGDVGFNWAFVAVGSNVSQIGVAEVGLPPSDLNSTDRKVILEDYSIKSVFTNEINKTWPGLSPELISVYLHNTDAPGYFNHSGFVSGGVSPGLEYDVFETAIQSLVPYNPLDVTNLSITFKRE